ncbi:hypothetical protein [Agromyces sp. ZXT2-3]|uniref:hypothetical protein n=1 Tax=Agromyces sp. ZXT2-3 TaxID=3461152 RepID=UPI004054ACF7
MTQRIRYGGAEFLATDATADAVLDYADGLASGNSVAIADIHARRRDGSTGRVRMLIGAGIPISVEAVTDDVPPVEEPEASGGPATIERFRGLAAVFRRRPLPDGDGRPDVRAYGPWDEL